MPRHCQDGKVKAESWPTASWHLVPNCMPRRMYLLLWSHEHNRTRMEPRVGTFTLPAFIGFLCRRSKSKRFHSMPWLAVGTATLVKQINTIRWQTWPLACAAKPTVCQQKLLECRFPTKKANERGECGRANRWILAGSVLCLCNHASNALSSADILRLNAKSDVDGRPSGSANGQPRHRVGAHLHYYCHLHCLYTARGWRENMSGIPELSSRWLHSPSPSINLRYPRSLRSV